MLKTKKTNHETQNTRDCWRPAGVWGDLLKIAIDVEELHISMLILGGEDDGDDYEDEDDDGDNDEDENDVNDMKKEEEGKDDPLM